MWEIFPIFFFFVLCIFPLVFSMKCVAFCVGVGYVALHAHIPIVCGFTGLFYSIPRTLPSIRFIQTQSPYSATSHFDFKMRMPKYVHEIVKITNVHT